MVRFDIRARLTHLIVVPTLLIASVQVCAAAGMRPTSALQTSVSPQHDGAARSKPRRSTFGEITEYKIPHCSNCQPVGITAGADSRMWVALNHRGGIDSIDMTGHFAKYHPKKVFGEYGIIQGPDGNIWFTGRMKKSNGILGSITPTGQVGIPYSGQAEPNAVASGPAGTIWFNGLSGSIQTIDVHSYSVAKYSLPSDHRAVNMVEGSDGNMWFTDLTNSGPQLIGKMTPSGIVSEFTIPDNGFDQNGIASGPDGNVWFTASDSSETHGMVGRCTLDGQITLYPVPSGSLLFAIASGPANDLYVTEISGYIGRVTVSGSSVQITDYQLSPSRLPLGVALGPDGNMWLTENTASGGLVARFSTNNTPDGTRMRSNMVWRNASVELQYGR